MHFQARDVAAFNPNGGWNKKSGLNGNPNRPEHKPKTESYEKQKCFLRKYRESFGIAVLPKPRFFEKNYKLLGFLFLFRLARNKSDNS